MDPAISMAFPRSKSRVKYQDLGTVEDSVDYLLVKELKSSGFPGSEHWSLESDDRLPDLGILIRACGNGFKKLRRNRRDQWTAVGKEIEETEPTPENAVGALWLHLEHNKRNMR